MTDADVIAAYRATAEPPEYPPICDEPFFPIAPIPKPTAHELAMDAQRAEPGGFGEWLEKNPEPSLNRLIERFGGYNRITAEAWDQNDEAMKEWLRRYRLRNNTQPAPPGSKD